MTEPTAYVEIEKIIEKRQEAVFHEGYAWETDEETYYAFYDAKKRFEVGFEIADYIIDLYAEVGEMVDTFPITEFGYRSLKGQGKRSRQRSK